LKSDLLITEADLDKDVSYYYHPDSVEFLNQGILESYEISKSDIIGGQPVYVKDRAEQKIYAYYVLKPGHKLSPAILVIGSGSLDRDDFNCSMNAIGYYNEFFEPEGTNSIIVLSKVTEKPFGSYQLEMQQHLKNLRKKK